MSGRTVGPVGTCEQCGKRMYPTKALAKKMIRQMHGRKGRLNAYKCGDYWHAGHLNKRIVSGEKER